MKQAARTRRWIRLATLATCAVSVVSIGCDDVGDGKALHLQAEAAALVSVGAGQSTDVGDKLRTVAESDRSSPAIVQGQIAYGQYLINKASADAATLASQQGRAQRLLARIALLTRQAATGRTLADNYRQLDPSATVTLVNGFADQARGNGNAATFEAIPGTALPTLAGAQQAKSALDGQVATSRETIDALTKQRDALLTQAGEASAAQESQAGGDRVASVTRAADLRQQAAILSRQLSDASNTLARQEADATLQANLVTQLTAGVEGLGGQAATLTAGWQKIAERADAQTAQAKTIINGTGAKPSAETVQSLAAELKATLDDVEATRKQVEADYAQAINTLSAAATKAGAAVIEINSAKSGSGGSPYEEKAWEEQVRLLAVDRINLDKASAERGLAATHMAHAGLLTQMLQVAKSLEETSSALKIPTTEPFDSGKLTIDLNNALNAADAAYTTVDATLDGVNLTDADLTSLRPARAAAKIFSLYEHALLCQLAGTSGAGGELPKKADDLLKSAQAAVSDAQSNSLPLPTLPESIRVAAPTTPPDGTAAPDAATPADDGATPDDATPTPTPTPNDATPTPDAATPPADGTTPPSTDAPAETPSTDVPAPVAP